MTDVTQKEELEAEIRTLETKKPPGPDGVTNDMILHLGSSAKKAILSTSPGRQAPFLLFGKKAILVPIHNKGKNEKHPSSYIPISFLSCLGKLLEHIIKTILMAYLEANNVLSQSQSGNRKHRTTEDQVAVLAQKIENAFQERKKAVSV